jgi:hypothetical protein
MRRRDVLAGLAAAAAPNLAMAAATKTVPLAKALGFLDAYYGLPPAARSRFYLAYVGFRTGRRAPDLKATVISAAGQRTPLVLDRFGAVAHLPSLAELKTSSLEVEDGPKTGFALQARLVAPLAAQLDVGAIEAALAQINQAVVKFAGPISLVVPKITCAVFPDAGPGHATLADGRTAPLPVSQSAFFGSASYFEPASFAGARTVEFARAPAFVALSPHPKT